MDSSDLHYVLDRWFDREVKPRLSGKAVLIRYGDDFLLGFERLDDAQRVMAVLGKRLGRFGLTLHPDKTRLLPFRRPPVGQRRGKGPATVDFLGFTLYWSRTRSGRWGIRCKTRSARLRRAIQSVADWCRRHRHEPVTVQHDALRRRIQGHFNYYAVPGNIDALSAFRDEVRRLWREALRRRSQRSRLTWERMSRIADRWLPPARIVHPHPSVRFAASTQGRSPVR